MRRPSRPTRASLKSLPSGVSGQQARLVVVEDESIIAMDLADQLEEIGYRVCATVDNCADALAAVEKHRPDLVLLDIVIKGELDGVETGRRIGHRFRTPVVYLTSYSDPTTLKRAMSTAPYGYVTKPFQLKELSGSLEAALYKARLESRLRESERWFSATLRCAADGVLAVDAAGRVQFLNPHAELTLGKTLSEVAGKPLSEVLVLEGEPLRAWPLDHDGPLTDICFGRWLVLPSKKRVPIDVAYAPLRDEANTATGSVVAFREVSHRLNAEAALQTSEERFRAAFDLAPAGMALVALSGAFLQGNAAMFKLLGVSESELLALTQADVSDPADRASERQHLHQLLSGDVQCVQFEKRYKTRARGDVWTLASVSLLSQSDQPLCYLYQVHDLTEQKRIEQQLTMLASVDALTGLANREELRRALDRSLISARRGERKLAVVFLDLDRFKQVNDTLGHEAGDQVLQAVATRLRAVVRDSDCIARLGGDEFVAVLPDVADADDALLVTQKLAESIRQPVPLTTHGEATVGVSMGVAMFPAHGGDVRALLRAADAALYHAKATGRDNTQLYRPELDDHVARRAQREGELAQAVRSGALVLDFQPAFHLGSGAARHVEALVRWQHPTQGRLLPGTFLSLAEEPRVALELAALTLRGACQAGARLPSIGGRPLEVAVNLSPRQLASDGLEGAVAEALRTSGLAPRRLCLELPARALLEPDAGALARVLRLKALGVQLAIDDVGPTPIALATLARIAPA
ncbi:MAG: diguanylate cyclase, partial [Polyangiales bacterium]